MMVFTELRGANWLATVASVEVTVALEPSWAWMAFVTLETLSMLLTVTMAVETSPDADANLWSVAKGMRTSESAKVEPEV